MNIRKEQTTFGIILNQNILDKAFTYLNYLTTYHNDVKYYFSHDVWAGMPDSKLLTVSFSNETAVEKRKAIMRHIEDMIKK